jgi:hypothetical protein
LPRFVGFIGPSYTMRSKNVDCQRTINLYPEMDEVGTGKEREIAALVSTPGLRLLASIGPGPFRAVYTASNDQLFVVSGNKLYRVASDMTPTELGTLNTSSGPVSIADQGLQLVVVDNPDGYVWDFNLATFTEIVDPNFLGASSVVTQDGYFIFVKPNSQQFFISGLLEVTFDAADVSSSEGNPDFINGVISDHRELWMFNKKSIEVYFDSGASDFPFERIQGAFIEHGLAATFSVAKMNNTVFWLGADDKGSGIVFQAQGYQPQRISTTAVELAIQSYGDISDAVAWTYQSRGHHFYVLNFTSANTTWVYDTSTNLWHERAYNNQGTQERHRANFHAYAFSKHIVGDYASNKLYELTDDVYSDNGVEIIRTRITPHVSNNLNRVFFNSFQLDIESGVGIDGEGQGVDPQAMLQWSDDGGHSWSNEKWVGMGAIGARYKRAIWRRLGVSRDRVFKVSISDPVKVTMIGANLEIEQGAS